uniref:acyl-coenzyme A diphosphatase NUDT19 isoform X1 n=1 Tax=Myxine glutinosa TaxID=7769 RepID=UPI00358F3AB2
MAAGLRGWREAATLVIAAKSVVGRVACEPGTSFLAAHGTDWPHPSLFDYRVLLLRRSNRSSFMPGAMVFPGGLVDEADFSAAWKPLLSRACDSSKCQQNFGLPPTQWKQDRAPLFTRDRSVGLPAEVAFRICAIRETFEESGVLLTIPMEDPLMDNCHNDFPKDVAKMDRWRQLIWDDATNFARMCTTLNCVPDIWALHEWSDWLTPAYYPVSPNRYDTVFFITCLKNLPSAVQDNTETFLVEWLLPTVALSRFESASLWLPRPQIYELSRLCRIPSLELLQNFSKKRAAQHGTQRWLPVILHATDGILSLLPGDDIYPEWASRSGEVDPKLECSLTMTELRAKSHALHRFEIRERHTISLRCSVQPGGGHLVPFSKESSQNPSHL